MKTEAFLRKYRTDEELATWALSISDDMADVWDAMIEQGKHGWLVWVATLPGMFSEAVLRKLACRFIREVPVSNGRTAWDLLTDERSRRAVEVAEAYADGKATPMELVGARLAAEDAANVAASTNAPVFTDLGASNAASYYMDLALKSISRCILDGAWTTTLDSSDSTCAATYADRAAEAADAAEAAAYASAEAAQIKMIAELGNPFRKERVK